MNATLDVDLDAEHLGYESFQWIDAQTQVDSSTKVITRIVSRQGRSLHPSVDDNVQGGDHVQVQVNANAI
jgi:hypothetical protein